MFSSKSSEREREKGDNYTHEGKPTLGIYSAVSVAIENTRDIDEEKTNASTRKWDEVSSLAQATFAPLRV